jgi:hypothetical protein
LVAELTRGKLAGEFEGHKARVLFVGADEDDWYEVVTPRLYAAGADLSMVREFVPVDDAAIFNIVEHIAELDRELRAVDFVVFEQLMDAMPRLKNATDPMEVRQALRPLRRVLAAREVTGLGALHLNKGATDQLRQKVQGSVQFGALSRSTIMVDKHPTDEDRRIAIVGKGNYVAQPTAMSFAIQSHMFDLNGRGFDVSRVVDVRDDDATLEDVLGARHERPRPRDARRDDVLLALSDEPQSVRDIAGATGVPKSTVQRVLEDLSREDHARRTDAGWVSHRPISKGFGTVGQAPQSQIPGVNGAGDVDAMVDAMGDVERYDVPSHEDDDRDDWRQR